MNHIIDELLCAFPAGVALAGMVYFMHHMGYYL